MLRSHAWLPLVLLSTLLTPLAGCSNDDSSSSNPAAPPGVKVAKSDLARITPEKLAEKDAAAFAASNQAFAFELYDRLASAAPGNVFVSPYSLQVALAMIYAGAKGTTQSEMRAALHFDLDEPKLHQAWNATDAQLSALATGAQQADASFQLHVVNQAWGQTGKTFLSSYLDVLAQNYGTGMFLLDFGKPAAARSVINQWVEDQTNKRITNLLDAQSIDETTRLVLTNAIYFKAHWATEFDAALTKDGTFHAAAGARTVPMMHEGLQGLYRKSADYEAVSLPYANQSTSMIVIMPAEGKFDAVVSSLDETFFKNLQAAMTETSITLTMPKFSFDATPAVKPALQALGMHEAFETSADFSGLDGARDLSIGGVVQKTFVAVDEHGTEAAAATAVWGNASAALNQAELSLDRPFIFMIYDEASNHVLFIGHLRDPG